MSNEQRVIERVEVREDDAVVVYGHDSYKENHPDYHPPEDGVGSDNDRGWVFVVQLVAGKYYIVLPLHGFLEVPKALFDMIRPFAGFVNTTFDEGVGFYENFRFFYDGQSDETFLKEVEEVVNHLTSVGNLDSWDIQ